VRSPGIPLTIPPGPKSDFSSRHEFGSPTRWAGFHPLASPNSRQTELRCPVCLERNRNAALLEVPSLANGSKLTLYVCSPCGSKFFDPPGISDFSDLLGKAEHFWKSYVEVVGGIWEMYWPAASSSRKPAASLLDVGCGFGFTLDAWRRLRGEAIGVELADYGRAGAERLGVLIYSDYLQDVPVLQTKRFDVVYASEVIEHVPNPREFAALLSRYVADDGVLCLTTPNAEFIREEHASPTLIAALSPGFHGFLMSPVEMERILRGCGFAHVLVRKSGERQFAWASKRPLSIDENSTPIRAEYLRYLDEILGKRTENDVVTDGIAYRHFRDTVLAGQFEAAGRSLSRLETSLTEKYQSDAFNPDRMLQRVRTLTTSESYSAAFPWFLPNFYFVRGMYAKLSEHDEQTARQFFRASRELTRYICDSWGPFFVLEALSFLPEAWQQEAVSAGLKGDPSVCEEWIASIANGGPETDAAFGGNRLSDRQIEQAYMEGLTILGALNRPEALRKALEDCLEYLADRYGDWSGASPTARDAIPGAALLHEQQMQLHLRIAATCTQLGAHDGLVRPLLERVIQLEKMQGTPSAMTRAFASEARARLASLSPNVNSWGTLNTRTTYNVSYSFRPSNKTKS
jgi:SAM-dependent methyltransferase